MRYREAGRLWDEILPGKARRRDTTWHAEFLDLVKDGQTFKAAVRELGVSPATLSEHFYADRACHTQSEQSRGRGLHGPAALVSPFSPTR